MSIDVLYLILNILSLFSIGGDWYFIGHDNISIIDSCSVFPRGSFNLWDYFCGKTANDFLEKRATFLYESVFIYTIYNVRIFVLITYVLSLLLMISNIFNKSNYFGNLCMIHLITTCNITSISFYIHGNSLITDTEFISAVKLYRFGFISELLSLPLLILLIRYNIHKYSESVNTNKPKKYDFKPKMTLKEIQMKQSKQASIQAKQLK